MNFLEKIVSIKAAFLIVIAMFMYELFINDAYDKYKTIKYQINSIKTEINNISEINKTLIKDTKELKTNNRILEIKARMELGLVKDQEIIYEIKD